MDQMKVIFAGLKKYHFWILCAVVVVAGLTSWYMSTSSLRSEAEKNAANIKSKESEVKNVLGINPHPNQDFLVGMDKMIDTYSISLAEGWQHRYDQQKDLLVWPARLGKDFIQRVDGLRPIEDHVTYDEKGYVASQEISTAYLERYRNFITLELPALADKIGAKWTAKVGEGRSSSAASSKGMSSKMGYGGLGSKRGGSSGTDEEEEEDDSIVYWDPSNQQEILDVHFGIASAEATPHTLDMLYAQEDLWVLDAIIGVIRRTNGDADANYNAAVKQIESIQMGRTVRGRLGEITSLDQSGALLGSSSAGPSASMSPPSASGSGSSAASPSSMMAPPSGSSMGPPPTGSNAGSSSASSMGTTTGPIDPATGRYVDIDYNPLEPKDLRAARTSEDAKLAIYSVAKRMPVRLRLRIDQRKLNDLLAECGNSSLPIEVRQVRINCPAGESGGSGGSSYGGGGFGGSSGGSSSMAPPSAGSMGPSPGGSGSSKSMTGPGKRSGGSRQGSMRSPSQSGEEESVDTNEIVVDVYGIVHIYNPLNQKQLNLQQAQGETPAAPVSPTAVTPVSAPPRS